MQKIYVMKHFFVCKHGNTCCMACVMQHVSSCNPSLKQAHVLCAVDHLIYSCCLFFVVFDYVFLFF